MRGVRKDQDPSGTAALIAAWTGGLARPVFVTLAAAELSGFVETAVDRLVRAARADPPDLDAAGEVGAALVDAGLLDATALPVTVDALARHLPDVVGAQRGPVLTAAVAGGYSRRLRERTLSEQESLRRAEVMARRRMEASLRASEARFRAIFLNSSIGIGIGDLEGRIVEANQAFAEMLGYSRVEFCRLNVRDFSYRDDAEGMWNLYDDIISGRRDRIKIEKRYRHRDGHAVWTDLTVSLIRDGGGRPAFTVAMAEDVTARREMQLRLREQASQDPLTRLANRTLFHDRLTAAFRDPGRQVGICYLDLDRFKAVNDRLGHAAGDALLTEMAGRLDSVVSAQGHLVARMGGDEFVVLAVDVALPELEVLAGALLAGLRKPVTIDGHEVAVSGSIGIVACVSGEMTPAEAMKAADVTLYWAKADGRDRWAVFDSERNARDMIRLALADELGPALERGEFLVEYQPIVRFDDGRVAGVEALVRWAHPRLGLLGPDRFVDIAEDTGAIVALGRHVLSTACGRIGTWNRAHPGAEILVSVNLSVRQTDDPGLVDDVAGVLEATGLPARLLQLELTESALLGPAGEPVDAIGALAATGIQIAVDDFGTGYSNLGYLTRLPLHSIKLAGELVEGLHPANPQAGAVVTSVTGLAHALGLQITAEGVETATQAEQLRAAGCDMAQGWHFARPMRWAELTAHLTQY